MAVKPLENLTLPVTATDMAAYLGLATPLSVADTSLLEGLLKTACGMVTTLTNREFLARQYSMTVDKFGHGPRMCGINPVYPAWDGSLSLPFAPVVSVESVVAIDADNEETELTADEDYYVDADLEPGKVRLEYIPSMLKMRIEFTAGYADEYDIPAEMILAVKMLTAWLYEHRGECDANNALSLSGARSVLSSVLVRFGL